MAAQLEENGCSRQSSPTAGDSDSEVADSARHKLESLLNRNMRIEMTDGRSLVGCFLCTDRDCNVILGSAQEFLRPSDSFPVREPRVLGLAMVPGHHIVSIEVELENVASPQYL
ncbi:N-alpha-acetyltransferase 38, auxiliary subunit [Pelobates cultripes]|uniref:N-alpha-acetyltransferase 38, auxiliary subunit n=1 Tax=Pelobates cultripes TaxID=61616 RepID=A0AAD1RIX8_PELCU|nr:N-alpha-acetyltransferase 38, auxiliary subunit [Pelobates cultripes]